MNKNLKQNIILLVLLVFTSYQSSVLAQQNPSYVVNELPSLDYNLGSGQSDLPPPQSNDNDDYYDSQDNYSGNNDNSQSYNQNRADNQVYRDYKIPENDVYNNQPGNQYYSNQYQTPYTDNQDYNSYSSNQYQSDPYYNTKPYKEKSSAKKAVVSSVTYGAIGAASGALLSGKNRGRNAAIGAGIGAVLGLLFGR